MNAYVTFENYSNLKASSKIANSNVIEAFMDASLGNFWLLCGSVYQKIHPHYKLRGLTFMKDILDSLKYFP